MDGYIGNGFLCLKGEAGKTALRCYYTMCLSCHTDIGYVPFGPDESGDNSTTLLSNDTLAEPLSLETPIIFSLQSEQQIMVTIIIIITCVLSVV